MIIDEKYIENLLAATKSADGGEIMKILDKAAGFEGLSPQEVAMLLNTKDPAHISSIFDIAGKVKEHIYGSRVVMFAPIYVSDYCVNDCAYCNFAACGSGDGIIRERRKLTQDELREEVRLLGLMGHKRLALEAGEDPGNCDIGYILECIRTIYGSKPKESGDIRRINVNIAAASVEDYRKLKNAGIGTYILFQETYHRGSYTQYHRAGPKADYDYHLTAFDRAMEAGLDDIGGGVLFGLYDAAFEVLGLMLHNQHLEEKYGVGFHTVSMPRLKNISRGEIIPKYPHILLDDDFLRICAVIRLALPFTGMIISTRETPDMRKKLITAGISQLSAGSNVEVGGYARASNEQKQFGQFEQFQLEDNRGAADIIAWLLSEGLIPSFCTACYRNERVGDRFMKLAKAGEIKNVCLPNALMTLCEYAQDYSGENSDRLRKAVQRICDVEVEKIDSPAMREYTSAAIEKIVKHGERDLYV